MSIRARRLPEWPLLTWCARLSEGELVPELFHGACVEVRSEWAIEGGWAGSFAEGDFDETSLVFGSGVRLRDGYTDFVSPGTNVDRLWSYEHGENTVVSNSLPALLAVADVSLLDEVTDYPNRIEPWTRVGTGDVRVPADPGPIRCTYFDNIRWDGKRLRTVDKSRDAPAFTSYSIYREFLFDCAREVVSNARSRHRSHPFSVATTVSSGYDSSAVAVAAKQAGCEKAVTIESARSVTPRSDSGEEVAEHLGLDCDVYPRSGLGSRGEIAFWAADGDPQGANFAVFDFEDRPCLLFTGVMGGLVWTKNISDLVLDLKSENPNVVNLSEYRLSEGLVHCPLVFGGARRAWEIFQLSNSEEMETYVVGSVYDRPIPRRMLEEAGVPRDAFGMKKSATQFSESFLWPYSHELQESYRSYLEERGIEVPPVRFGRALNWAESNLLFPVRARLLRYPKQARIFGDCSRLLFQWANHRIAQKLESQLGAAEFV